jgi:hypothetical protein
MGRIVAALVCVNVGIAVYAITQPPVEWVCDRMKARAAARCDARIAAFRAEVEAERKEGQ